MRRGWRHCSGCVSRAGRKVRSKPFSKARSALLSLVADRVTSWGLTQGAAAARLGITRPRLGDLICGKLGKFSLEALLNLAAAAGLALEIRAVEAA